MTIKSLDGLRGFAVLLVLLSHMSLGGMNLLPILDFSGVGKAGVYLFFALSAFLLTWQAITDKHDVLKSGNYWLGYAVRRVLRIYPLYVIVLIASFLGTRYAPGYITSIESAEELARHVGLLAGNHIYWAIPVEFKYYLLLPAVCLLLAWGQSIHSSLPAALTIAAVAAVTWFWPPAETAANSIALMPYLGIFLLGSLAAVVLKQYRETLASQEGWLGWIGWLAIGAGLLTVPHFWRLLVDPEAANQVFHRSFVLYGLIWSVAIIVASAGSNSYTRFFSLTPCRFLGRISFSVYLWHYPLILLVNRHVPVDAAIKSVIAIGVTLIVSYVSYRIIERPFIMWGHNLTRDWRKQGPIPL